MKLKRVGFFRELRHGLPNDPSLCEAVTESKPPYDVSRVVAYLQKGTLFVASPGIVRDVLKEGGPIIGAPHIRSDGVWAWPSDFAYYVTHYQVALPQDFVDHMERNGWQPPSEEVIRLETLEMDEE